ncbi:MAG: peptidase [Phenylobacterium sp.]
MHALADEATGSSAEMTYCLGMLLREGLIMMADTRTNAGIDNLSTYRKLRVLGQEGESLIAVASAGSLSTTQIAIERAIEGFIAPDTGIKEMLGGVQRIHRAAFLLGQAIRKTTQDWKDFTQEGIALDASLLVGGTVRGERTRLFMIYGAGNFIECGPETPFLQIGERKFGQPILDRALRYETPLVDALKLGLLSFNTTMRSNDGVDLPIDIMTARAGFPQAEMTYRVTAGDPYYRQLDAAWSGALTAAIAAIPSPPYMDRAANEASKSVRRPKADEMAHFAFDREAAGPRAGVRRAAVVDSPDVPSARPGAS